ncbi:MAG: prepilin peptidase [Puniceicoccales bacterium]|jgi:prepilin signal peptidase PulO-like enzyme (type II secretory pathway)|nr:prepilin peptidase [Puniceicoccales bacterium]
MCDVLLYAIFLFLMHRAAVHDRKAGLIPDRICYSGIAFALLWALLFGDLSNGLQKISAVNPLNYPVKILIDVLVVSGGLLWIAMTFESLAGREGLGFGDIKLVGLMGAFLGIGGAVHGIFYGAWLAVFIETFRRRRRHFCRNCHIPFAPYLFYGSFIQCCISLYVSHR